MSNRVVMICAVLCGLTACAAAPAPAPATAARPDDPRVAQLVAQSEVQSSRMRELEARLSVMESESRDLRAQVSELSSELSRRSTHVTAQARRSREHEETDALDIEAPETDRRPMLRLVGEPSRPVVASAPASSASLPPLPLDAPPPGTPSRLPVTSNAPGFSGRDVPPITATASATAPTAVDPVAHYRAALALVTTREFSRAHEALSRFLEQFPSHAYADNAMYWRGEVWFLQGEYARAMRDYEAVVTRFPNGNKAADALWRIAACHARLGHQAEARTAVDRIRREYPTSEAAQRASQRDAT